MRGLSVPTGALLPAASVNGIPRSRQAPAVRPAEAKKLLAEAGYPNGFEVTLDCPNNRYVNDEKICLALAGDVGADRRHDVKRQRDAARATTSRSSRSIDTSMYMLGWGGAATDAIFMLQPVLSTLQRQGRRRLQLRQLQERRSSTTLIGEDQGRHESRRARST